MGRAGREFLLMFLAQALNFALLCWNYRAVALGYIPTTVLSDFVIAAVQFKLIKRVALAQGNASFAGYVLGGAVGSAISVYLTKAVWGV